MGGQYRPGTLTELPTEKLKHPLLAFNQGVIFVKRSELDKKTYNGMITHCKKKYRKIYCIIRASNLPTNYCKIYRNTVNFLQFVTVKLTVYCKYFTKSCILFACTRQGVSDGGRYTPRGWSFFLKM